MRVLVFHGYLLAGTGSNVYNARLAEALVALGHEVHLLCQDRHPERYPFATAAGDWDGGALRVRELPGTSPATAATAASGARAARAAAGSARAGGGCTIYRPDIGKVLPVYVQDSYEGVEARTFADCDDAEIADYVRANVAAVREVAERAKPELALANHLVMGPAILARALGTAGVPYAVKVHGSALEYTVKPQPERFLGYAREGVAAARTVLVGSTHTARSLWRALEDPSLPARTRLGPPGVDVERFAPRQRGQAAADLAALAKRLRARAHAAAGGASGEEGQDAFARDEAAVASAIERLCARAEEGELVAFVGKLIAAKGVDLLLDAWPLVLERRPQATLAAIGFGAERERLEAKAQSLGERVLFTGRLEHDELAGVLPLCEALVVPSTFPEAFGMVAAEAAACGVLPISAAHSGLAEVSEELARALPARMRPLLSFPVDGRAPAAIAERVLGWLDADESLRRATREALVAGVRERWSWEGVARGAIAAALGRSEAPLARTVG